MEAHEQYMRRCLQLAALAEGNTRPNPMVGSVIVHNNTIIGEGFHQLCGQAHAEVNAIAAVADQNLLTESTLYVNLEPCAHWGRTPPCAQLIIDKKIPKVVIGCVDTFSKVAGKGIEMLRNAGIEVLTGVLEEESRLINKRFFTFHEKKRPYIILKWAQTLDGFIDLAANRKNSLRGVWITDAIGKTLVHKWRTREDAIMVGTNTARNDNPQLNARLWPGTNPVRVVIDRKRTLPTNLFLLDKTIKTIVFTETNSSTEQNLEYVSLDFSVDIIPQILGELHKRSIQSVIIEGGQKLLNSFISLNLWDEAQVFIGQKLFCEGISAPSIDAQPMSITKIGASQLLYYINR